MTRKIRQGHSWVASLVVPLHPDMAAEAMATGLVALVGTDPRFPVIEVYCRRCRRSRDRVLVVTDEDGTQVDEPCVVDGVQQGGPRKGNLDGVPTIRATRPRHHNVNHGLL